MRKLYLTSIITFVTILLGLIVVWLIPNPLGGEPHVVINLKERGEVYKKLAEIKNTRITKELKSKAGDDSNNLEDPIYFAKKDKQKSAVITKKHPESKTSSEKAKDKKSTTATKIAYQRPEYKELPPAPITELSEQGEFGPLPRIANDGRRAQIAYAHPNNHYHVINKKPAKQIAILITDLGLSEPITKASVEKLPPAVTFTFSPYGRSLNNWMRVSRRAGHELLLQVPMEPFDYPDNDPGPQALLTQLSDAVNLNRLHWVMSRMSGYIGMINLTGTKLSADESAMYPLLREFKNRGLIYIDGNPQAPVIAQKLSNELKLDYLKTNVVLDQIRSAEEIDKSLAKLEKSATKHGNAIGIAAALPLTIERIVKWSKTLEKRGFVLVPLSAAIPYRQS